MSSSSKPKPGCFGRDIHRLLLAAEAGQKADILTYCSGHLGPRSLNQSQPHRETKQFFWRTSQEETPALQKRQTSTQLKKKAMKEPPSEFTSGTALVESGVSGSRRDQALEHSLHVGRREDISIPKTVYCSTNSLPIQLKAHSQKKSNSSCDPEEKHQFSSNHSDQEGLSNKAQLAMKQQFGRQAIAPQDLWAGMNAAEMHERKLQKELSKLSAQSWPSRDRLVVFSDVFDDVCEGSPVFGRILREIKTDYDLYINHLMASQSPQYNMSLNTSLKDLDEVREIELMDAEKEVCRLEQEVRRALEENKRAQNELHNLPAVEAPEDSDMKDISLPWLQDSRTAVGCADSVQFRRLQVLNTWKEIQQLEEEIKEKLVSTVTTTAIERAIKGKKTEIMKLIASNERLRTISKDLENNINMVLTREKGSKAMRRMLWDEIYCDLPAESE